MIGRSAKRIGHFVAVGTLTLGLVTAGFVTHPVSAVAAAMDVQRTTHLVLFEAQGTQSAHTTPAATVGAFLKERGIVPGPQDYVRPGMDTPLTDNVVIDYSPAVPVRLVTQSGSKTIVTSAEDVGALLEEQGVHLGPLDIVRPSLSDPIVSYATIRVTRVQKWVSSERHDVAEHTIDVIDFALPPGKTKVIRHGSPGLTETVVDYTQTAGRLAKHVLQTRVLRKPQTRIIAQGVGTYAAIADLAWYGMQKTSYIAAGALEMIATAYTAECAGCSGYTATGSRAGHGIVAVDPGVIPLGSKLFIPGYGFAIAGDTGGAIVGRRIDLGFDSIADAIQFGRRAIKVYTLK